MAVMRKFYPPPTVNGFETTDLQLINDVAGVHGSFEIEGPPTLWTIGNHVQINDASGNTLATGYVRRISTTGHKSTVEWDTRPLSFNEHLWGVPAAEIIDHHARQLARRRPA